MASSFFKQKTAYEILSGLVGSEMCIRDRFSIWPLLTKKINPDYAAKMLEDAKPGFRNSLLNYVWFRKKPEAIGGCLLYTSDAADE